MIRRCAIVVVAVVLALTLAGSATALLTKALQDPLLAQCLATGKLTFDKPLPESVARSINEECRAGLIRQDIIARARPSFGLTVMMVMMGNAARLLDPIHDVMAAVFGFGAYAFIAWLWPARRREQV